ncbi:unnamed protein product [Clonostachys byssicola]|uniref:Heterokaryon incompatibility domain-containing protein n=1 Tax=Clonostachys byssicola TaxID=160290 RepID=A0A9N9XV11_9HYPO|nr:unnamed protein product [Clonostachys byssicola]
MASFEYSRLNLERPSFRLLRLVAGHGPTIECEIFQSFVATAGGIPYEALSYTWGGNDKPETIVANGKRLAVTINLYQALNHLRQLHCDRILWIDALCIDQENSRERNHQVSQMTDIYKNADSVIYWLGQPTYATNVALDSLKTLETLSASVACRDWTTTDGRWQWLWSTCQSRLAKKYPDLIQNQRKGLQDLLQRPWFERVWIIQEVANSRRGIVCCGAKSVSARIFALSCYLFAFKPSSQAQAILDIMPSHPSRDSSRGQKHDLYTLLCMFHSSKAQDPRDMVYALLGIASDPNLRELLKPDYEKTERDVIRGCVAYFCKLDIENLPDFSQGYWNGMINDETMHGFLKSIHSLYMAAMDQHLRAPIEDDTENFIINKGHHVRITNEMLVQCGKLGVESSNLLELLIKSHASQAMLENAARNWQDLKWLDLLLQTEPDRVIDAEPILMAATKNPKAEQVLCRIIETRRDVSRLTTAVLNAAAGAPYPDTALLALSNMFVDDFTVTEDMILLLEENGSPRSHTALKEIAHHPSVSPELKLLIVDVAKRKFRKEGTEINYEDTMAI